MSFITDNQQKINEVIFANRNKSYGAYAIRSSYGHTLARALFLVMFGFISLMSLAYYLAHRGNDLHKNEQLILNDSLITVVCDVKKPDVQKPKVVEPPRSNPSAGGGSAMGTQVQDSLAANSNTVTNENAAGTGTGASTGTGTSTFTGTGSPTIISTPTIESDPVYIADRNPEFEGGLPALYRFLSAKLVYPEIAKELGKEGTVFVRFVVDEGGRVGTLSLLNNAGYGLDEEALRVVGMLPKFKSPGILNGKPVKVYFQLPIKFKLQ